MENQEVPNTPGGNFRCISVSQERNELAAKFQRLRYPTFSADSLKLVPTLSDVGRQPEIAMAACTPEVVITQERNEIAAKSQRQPQHFRPWPSHWNWYRHCPMSADNRK